VTPALLAGLLALSADPASGGVDLLFPTGGAPARLRVEVTGAGGRPDAGWAAFLDRLFDHFDRDGNGALSAPEVVQVFPLPLPGGKTVATDFAGLDADRDGRATRSEFKAFYRRAGFAPVVVVPTAPSADDLRLAAALFRHLDRDGDGQLTASEVADAPRLLRRLDEDEDEALTRAEILAAAPKASTPARVPAWPEPAPADPAAVPGATLRIPLTGGGRPELVVGSNNLLRALDPDGAAGRIRIGIPGGECVASVSAADPAAGVREAREFLLAQFRAVAGNRAAVSKEDAERDPTLRALAGVFNSADRDGDGELTEAELAGLLSLVEQGVGSQVVLTAADRGRSLFDRFDGDGDGRLDLWELRLAGRLASASALTRDAVPRGLLLTASRGPVGPTFGPVPVASPARATATPVPRRASGPAWFRAVDRNGDGFVSPAEFVGPPELFGALDADADGRISAAEADAARK
jgi:Ca2+-binding EF-hand superfamily protein